MKAFVSFAVFWIAALGICAAQQISGFTLIDATTDTDLHALNDGDTLFLSSYSTASFNIRANTNPNPVGSVRFDFAGNPNFRTENAAPYALHGDNAGNYNAWTPAPGEYRLGATAFSGTNASGTASPAYIVHFTVVAAPPGPGCGSGGSNTVTLSGETRVWHRVTLDFEGPYFDETCVPNPFLDYRLNVTFTKGSKTYVVPGFFAADGDAAESSSAAGNIWRCHFAPDEAGVWNWSASFRTGPEVAVSMDSFAGVATDFDGMNGSLTVSPSNKSGRDHRAKGRLEYVGERYLRFAGTGEYFLKGGADAPENLLAYEDFDNTPNTGGWRKSWSPHAGAWQNGDPDWQGGKGRELIGALNYLASKGMNAFSFLTMNINGDDRNVFPYITYNGNSGAQDDRRRFDVSKLAQWEIIFSHADQMGLFMHFKMQETENDLLLDNGDLGVERRLYYRELVARFGHHLALNWNLGEENNIFQERNDPSQSLLKAYTHYLRRIDPYNHHIVLHSYPGQQGLSYTPFLGVDSALTGISLQTGVWGVHSETLDWINQSQQAGSPWVVANDEQGPPNYAVPPDPGYQNYVLPNGAPTQDDVRRLALWGNLMAGGAGVEYYFGYSLPQSDLSCQDWSSRDRMWDYTRNALEFFQAYVPFWEMQSQDGWVSNGYCLAKAGQTYLVYLPSGGNATLNLAPGTYTVNWYNPRSGGNLIAGSNISGGTTVSLGSPPADPTQDWAIVVAAEGQGLPVEWLDFEANPLGNSVMLNWTTARESNSDYFAVERSVGSGLFLLLGTLPAAGNSAGLQDYRYKDVNPPSGTLYYRLHAVDIDGSASYSEVVEVNMPEAAVRQYPNPVKAGLFLELPGAGEPYDIRIYDCLGREMGRWEQAVRPGEGPVSLPLEWLYPGRYGLWIGQGNALIHRGSFYKD